MSRRIIKLLIALNVFILIVAGIRFFLLQHNRVVKERQNIDANALRVKQAGIMDERNYKKYRDILDNIGKTGSITDAELDWSITLIKSSLGNSDSGSETRRTMIVYEWRNLKQSSPSQRDKIFETLTLLFQTKNKFIYDKISAIQAVEHLREKRGIPYLLPLLDDPHEEIRSNTRRALFTLGYKTSS